MVLLGGCYGVAMLVSMVLLGVAMFCLVFLGFAMVLLGSYYGVARCYGVAR